MLTLAQIAAIIGLLVAFNTDPMIVKNVQDALEPQVSTSTVSIIAATSTVQVSPQGAVVIPIDKAPSFGATISTMTPNSLTFTGQDGNIVKVYWSVDADGNDIPATTTITVYGADGLISPSTAIEVFNSPYGANILNGTTDDNGQYVFNVSRFGSGNLNFTFKVPSLNISQKVNILSQKQ